MNWLLYAILGAVLAGASPVFAKSGMRKSNSHLAAALRGTLLFLGACFMVNQTGSGVNFSGIKSMTWAYLLFSGIATGLVWVCLLRALQLGQAGMVVSVVEGSIILDLLVGIFLFHEGISWNKIIILVLFIAGTLMMAIRGSKRSGKSRSWIWHAIGAMIFTTVTGALSRIGISGVDGYAERMIRYGIALVLVWLVVFATKGYKGLRALSFLDGLYLCMSGIAMSGAWYCFYKGYVLGTNAVVDIVERFDLVAAIVLSCVFLRERMTVRAIFGMVFMMLGFLLLLADLPIIPL